ncbi:MAG TPA: hypothetical protein VEX37_06530, partial [Thermomicrobiales bacterium]|nr:hypothetical protein [Thermomicrobiales bacterium]
MSGFRAQRRMFNNTLVALVVVAVLALSLVPAPVAAQFSGAVVAWGNNDRGQTNVPAGLRDVAAIDAGPFRTVALKTDGTVVAWGEKFFDQTVPAGLSNVVAIDAGAYHNVALKADGTVVAWGDNDQATAVPAGLSNVVAIDAGS